MAALIFYASTARRWLATGRVPIQCRLYHGRTNQRTDTGVFAPVSCWNDTEGRCTISRRFETSDTADARRAQAELDELRDYILRIFQQDYPRGLVTAGWLGRIIKRRNEPQQVTLTPLADLVEPYSRARDLAPTTARKVAVLANMLRDYSMQHNTLYLETLTTADVENFANWLAYDGGTTRARGQNSVASRMRQLRALVYWRGRPTPDPFRGYTMPQEVYGTPIYLTREERDAVAQCDRLTPAKAVQRDIFVFQCMTGCRVSDLYALTADNITADGWLIYYPQKTAGENGQRVEVLLTATARDIVQRYSGGRTLLPFISAPRYIDAIRDILRTVGITRPVLYLDPRTRRTIARPLCDVAGTHTARKTFTQIVYSATPDKRLVASMTGHSENSRAFNRYSVIDRGMKRRAIEIAEQ